MNIRLTLKGVSLRLAQLEDAAFILELRTDNQLGQFLNKTKHDIENQLEWLRGYKERESARQEFYFIIEDEKTLQRYGTVRVYNLTDNQFTSGSWIIKKGSPEDVALISDYLITYFGFVVLDYQTCYFDVRKNNKKVVAFHKRFAEVVKEEGEDLFMIMDKPGYFKKKNFYKLVLNEENDPTVVSDVFKCLDVQ